MKTKKVFNLSAFTEVVMEIRLENRLSKFEFYVSKEIFDDIVKTWTADKPINVNGFCGTFYGVPVYAYDFIKPKYAVIMKDNEVYQIIKVWEC